VLYLITALLAAIRVFFRNRVDTSLEVLALDMVVELPGDRRRVTLGADKNYDTREFVDLLRQGAITPHVAQNQWAGRSSAIDARTTRHGGFHTSQQKRKRVEEIFGWMKTIGGLRKVKLRGRDLVGWMFTFAAAAYNLVGCETWPRNPRENRTQGCGAHEKPFSNVIQD
jgi:hypothetical protein